MTMKMVFNELSLTPARTKNSRLAAAWMRELIGVLKAARAMACEGSFVVLTSPDFKQMEIMRGYYIQEWLKDADPDSRAAFLAFFAVFRFIPVHDLQVEYRLHDRCPLVGLGIAHREDCIAVSLPSRPRWTAYREIRLHLHELDEHGDMIPAVLCYVRHASGASHMQNFALVWQQIDKHRLVIGWGTIMPLDDATAQKVLNCSIQIEDHSQRYGYHDRTLYEFQYDNAGSYHGYPVEVQDLREAGKHHAVLGMLRDEGRLTEAEFTALIN